MNPLKYDFDISSKKFVGFVVHRKRIDLDLAKAKVIQDVEHPKTVKELKIGSVSLWEM